MKKRVLANNKWIDRKILPCELQWENDGEWWSCSLYRWIYIDDCLSILLFAFWDFDEHDFPEQFILPIQIIRIEEEDKWQNKIQ